MERAPSALLRCLLARWWCRAIARDKSSTQRFQRRRCSPAGEPHPLDREKFFRYPRARLDGAVYDHGQEKGVIVGHVKRSLDGEPPLPAEIALGAHLGLGGYERHEKIAFADLPTDLLVPRVPSVQGAFVVPDLKPARRQGVPDGLRRRAIFRGVAQRTPSGAGERG